MPKYLKKNTFLVFFFPNLTINILRVYRKTQLIMLISGFQDKLFFYYRTFLLNFK